MLITLECVLFALQAVAAVRVSLESPFESTSQSSNRLSKRSPVELGGDISRCFRIKLYVNGVDLGLQVDSAISSIVVPLPSSSSDVSLTPQHTPSGEPVTIKYKGDEYNGITSTADVTIPGTRITDINLPVIAVEKQSADLVGIDPNLDGIFGFGYPLLSKHHSRITAMDILYSNNVIPNNEISIQLCPYDMTSDSFINIGNTEITAKCGTDGKSVAWIQSPTTDHHTVNIKNILVNDKQVDLPEEFQQVVENGRTLYSYLQTCSTYMIFPKVVVATLVDAIVGSNAIIFKSMFSKKLSKREIENIFWENHPMIESTYNIDWEKLSTITITVFSQTPVTDDNRNSVVTIKLGPRDYIQRYDSEDCKFAIKAGSNDKAILGIPFMTRLELSFDRAHKRIGFGPGCGCEVATDGYPTISDHYRVLWPSSQLPEQPSTSGSDGTFIRRRKPTTTTNQVAVPENTHHTVKSRKQTLNKLD
ncbi:hypothetical protein BATDEDRAFT_87250 [Batrachochytrium dendrobatidis JAM81]|uniref:Peptidase A1 domain-containing protein n=1 Tax=Batrachochytrium dendrobatidis (strain JAM81 / FGSC 10211) TaxID=684364 RepID=F4NYZ6_BATDJ|nr:uncharacterized protein BATDEDRAFT_87250 [Batrachochytrium dendrobatidis JAM81]EGF81796.1 hypothetical protein BATDEDRAFT_87250 [Batrachochytrium dendrobatidis JAM81]|eukprot:XP_006677533.1 hypothetical protein BATDEDRAFT_87250 [Batrachochytrium dendrobatidis JAM81]